TNLRSKHRPPSMIETYEPERSSALPRLHYRIRVALFTQIDTPMLGKADFVRPARDECIERARGAVRVRAEDPAQPLGLLLPGTEVARDLNRDRCLRQIDPLIGHAGDDERARCTAPERSVLAFPIHQRRCPGHQWGAQATGD